MQSLTENGVMDAARLYQSPFRDIIQPAKVTETVLKEIWADMSVGSGLTDSF